MLSPYLIVDVDKNWLDVKVKGFEGCCSLGI